MARVKVFDKNKNEWVYADKALAHIPIKGVDYYTEPEKAEMVTQVKAAMPTLTVTGIDENGVSHTWLMYGVSQE